MIDDTDDDDELHQGESVNPAKKLKLTSALDTINPGRRIEVQMVCFMKQQPALLQENDGFMIKMDQPIRRSQTTTTKCQFAYLARNHYILDLALLQREKIFKMTDDGQYIRNVSACKYGRPTLSL